MTRLIEQLLDFATARLGGLPIRPQPSNLTRAVRCGSRRVPSERSQLYWEVHGDPSGTWDPDRLLQVLANLIGNAIQHGDAEHPVKVRIEGQLDATVRIEVENTGTIPPEIRETIFSPFVRSTDSSRGAGLGLYIVEQIAKAHGGSVSVRTSDNDTTVFEVVTRVTPLRVTHGHNLHLTLFHPTDNPSGPPQRRTPQPRSSRTAPG